MNEKENDKLSYGVVLLVGLAAHLSTYEFLKKKIDNPLISVGISLATGIGVTRLAEELMGHKRNHEDSAGSGRAT